MTKTASWVDQAAKDLGITNEQPCGHCKGKGTIRRAPTKGSIAGALGYSFVGAKPLGKSLTDPPPVEAAEHRRSAGRGVPGGRCRLVQDVGQADRG